MWYVWHKNWLLWQTCVIYQHTNKKSSKPGWLDSQMLGLPATIQKLRRQVLAPTFCVGIILSSAIYNASILDQKTSTIHMTLGWLSKSSQHFNFNYNCPGYSSWMPVHHILPLEYLSPSKSKCTGTWSFRYCLGVTHQHHKSWTVPCEEVCQPCRMTAKIWKGM